MKQLEKTIRDYISDFEHAEHYNFEFHNCPTSDFKPKLRGDETANRSSAIGIIIISKNGDRASYITAVEYEGENLDEYNEVKLDKLARKCANEAKETILFYWYGMDLAEYRSKKRKEKSDE